MNIVFVHVSANVLDSKKEQSLSITSQETVKIAEDKPLPLLRIRNLPGDKLSVRKLTL